MITHTIKNKQDIETKLALSIRQREEVLEARRWGGIPYLWESQKGDMLQGWIDMLEGALAAPGDIEQPSESSPETYYDLGLMDAYRWLVGGAV